MNTSFLIRWQGRVIGPLTQEEVERRLTANEIGMLHEIQFNGSWMSLRMFLDLKNIQEKTERARRDEEDRQAREEIERQERQQAEKINQEKLLHLKRQNELLEQRSVPPLDRTSCPPSGSHSGFRSLGIILLAGGLAIAGYFFLAFDASVESGVGGFGRINNLGLMADRQNGIIVGIGLAVVGTIMLAIGSRSKN